MLTITQTWLTVWTIWAVLCFPFTVAVISNSHLHRGHMTCWTKRLHWGYLPENFHLRRNNVTTNVTEIWKQPGKDMLCVDILAGLFLFQEFSQWKYFSPGQDPVGCSRNVLMHFPSLWAYFIVIFDVNSLLLLMYSLFVSNTFLSNTRLKFSLCQK